jgi:hypothetical protein
VPFVRSESFDALGFSGKYVRIFGGAALAAASAAAFNSSSAYKQQNSKSWPYKDSISSRGFFSCYQSYLPFSLRTCQQSAKAKGFKEPSYFKQSNPLNSTATIPQP